VKTRKTVGEPKATPEQAELLITCTRAHKWGDPPPEVVRLLSWVEPVAFAEHCERHGVGPAVYLALRGVENLDPMLLARLEEQYFVSVGTHARCIQDLTIAGRALDAGRVPWMAFKGPVLAEAVYTRPDLRAYVDLDLLVAPSRLADAIGALEAAGGVVLDRNWLLALRRMHGELHVRMPTGTIVDLHWHVLNEPLLRSAFHVDTDELISRARTVGVAGMQVPTFDETDTLVQLGLHAAMAGGNRLLWCKDLEQAVTNRRPDWDQVIARARAASAGPPVAVMLALASRALCFDIPSGVISELSPGALWIRLTRGADRMAPVERWSGGRSVVRDVARATRRNDRASMNALVRRYASMLRTGRLGRPYATDRDPHSPGSVLFAAGDDADRAAFLAQVARHATRARDGAV
jgi:hypothetical protein